MKLTLPEDEGYARIRLSCLHACYSTRSFEPTHALTLLIVLAGHLRPRRWLLSRRSANNIGGRHELPVAIQRLLSQTLGRGSTTFGTQRTAITSTMQSPRDNRRQSMRIRAHSIHCLPTAVSQTRTVATEVLRGFPHVRSVEPFARAMLAGLRRRSSRTDLLVLARQAHAEGQPASDRTHRFRSRTTRER